MAKILDSLHNFFNQPAQKLTRINIPPSQVVDFQGSTENAVIEGTYVRIWVSEVYIKDAMRWAVNLFPFANGSVILTPPEQKPGSIQAVVMNPERNQVATKGIFTSFLLLPLTPFRGGTIEISTELVKLTGDDYFKETLNVLQGVSSIALGAADSAIKIAQMVKSGINRLYNIMDGEVVLAFRDTFTDENLRPGYIAIVDAPQNKYRAESFFVKDHRLHYPDPNTPFEDANHLLIRIELRVQHESWTAISAINDLVDEACGYYEKEKPEEGDFLKPAISEAIRKSASLTKADRIRVKKEAFSNLKDCANFESFDLTSTDGADVFSSPSEFAKIGDDSDITES